MRTWLFRHFFTVLPIDAGYFKRIPAEKKLTLSDELIDLNFRRFSPYPDADIIAMQTSGVLYLWYMPKSDVSDLVVPEALIFFESLIKEHTDVIARIRQADKDDFVVIKDKQLVASFSTLNEQVVQSMKMKYAIDRLVTIEPAGKREFLEESIRTFPLKRWVQLASRRIDVKSQVPLIADRMAYPAAAFATLLMLADVALTDYLKTSHQQVKQEYLEAKKLNDPIRERQNRRFEWNEKIHRLQEREFDAIPAQEVLQRLTQNSIEQNATMISLRIDSERAVYTFVTALDNVVSLRMLTGTGLFEHLRIVRNRVLKRTGRNMLTIEGTLSSRANDE